MADATCVFRATAGEVTVRVLKQPGRCRDEFVILLEGEGSDRDAADVRRQAEMFVAYEEQLARMAWCPSCGG